ncbi:isoprenylcysteine carboxylmethyltransferase family protein [Candidatus Woesearchaeota archaeon]|nr:isoprenylcysteine carboxylmethyltransferase family protein [Candidatus Woesearchaeota archaeon]
MVIIELFLILFMCLMIPIPWIIISIHILVKEKLWNVKHIKKYLLISILIIYTILGYLIYQYYQFILIKTFDNLILKILGIVILILALLIELFTTKILGTKRIFGSTELKRKKEELITQGIYKFARHPRYLEHPFWFLGLGLLFGYQLLIFFAFYLFISLSIAAYFEEQELITRYGKQYLEYKKKVPAFFIR